MLRKLNAIVQDYYAGAIFLAIGLGFALGLVISGGAEIKDYQALIGSTLALAAALFAIRVQRIHHEEQQFGNVAQSVMRVSLLARFLTAGGEWADEEKAAVEYDEFFSIVNIVSFAGLRNAGGGLALDMMTLSNAQALRYTINEHGHGPSVDAATRLANWAAVSMARGRFGKYPQDA